MAWRRARRRRARADVCGRPRQGIHVGELPCRTFLDSPCCGFLPKLRGTTGFTRRASGTRPEPGTAPGGTGRDGARGRRRKMMAFEFGMFHEFQRTAGMTDEDAFAVSFEQVDAAERWCLDAMWLAEIHVAPERSLCSAPLTPASAIAARTTRMTLG